jgi:U11/U12 small nuclear ribonucleoprotein SNRNP31
MFGRQLKASIAKDNGRSDEFAGQQHKKKPTTDPNSPRRCFECGQDGHLSYECPKNLLGVRPLPAGKKLKGPNNSRKTKYDSDASGDEDDEADSLSAAIRCEVSI